MFPEIFLNYVEVFQPFNVFRYITFRTGGAILTALIISFILGPILIRKLRAYQRDGQPIRLDGPKIENIKNTNIKSEGLVKGTIQITADGDPIVMLSDHGTIGGYPKIGVVISADYDKLVQIPPGSKIKFKEINLKDAETIYKLYEMETRNLISKIK